MIVFFVDDIVKAAEFFQIFVMGISSGCSLNVNSDTDYVSIQIPRLVVPVSLIKKIYGAYLENCIPPGNSSSSSMTTCLSVEFADFSSIKAALVDKGFSFAEISEHLILVLGPENIRITVVASDEKESAQLLPRLMSLLNLNLIKEASNVTNEVINRKEVNVGEPIPTLHLSVLNSSNNFKLFKPISANMQRPIRFKTELFDGEILFLVNTANSSYNPMFSQSCTSPYSARFTGDSHKITFDLQVQGKFLQIPSGKLFCGAEISKCMQLSLIIRGMCGTILQLGRRMNASLHHSFGDKDNFEKPHIVSPLWSTIDKLVISQSSQVPPPMGQVFPEPSDHRRDRKRNYDYDVSVSLDSVYSFSVSTENIDLINWRAVNIPLLSSLALSTFWNDADLTLCVYCIPSDSSNSLKTKPNGNGQPTMHPQSVISYCFAAEVKHTSNHPDQTLDAFVEDGNNEDATSDTDKKQLVSTPAGNAPILRVKGEISELRRTLNANFVSYDDYNDDDKKSQFAAEDVSDCALDSDSALIALQHDDKSVAVSEGVYSEDEEEDEGIVDDDVFYDALDFDIKLSPDLASNDNSTAYNDVEISQQNSFANKTQDLKCLPPVRWVERDLWVDHCVAVVEVEDTLGSTLKSLGSQSQRFLYAFRLCVPWSSESMSHTVSFSNLIDGVAVVRNAVVFRSFNEWSEAGLSLYSHGENPPLKLARKASAEQRRIALQRAYRIACCQAQSGNLQVKEKLQEFLSDTKHTSAFLCPTVSGLLSKKLQSFTQQQSQSLRRSTSYSKFNISLSMRDWSNLSQPHDALKQILVAVQAGPNYWCEEIMSLNQDSVVFLSLAQLGRVKRFSLPYASIIDVVTVESSNLPFTVSQLKCMLISSFSRQFTILMRCDDLTFSDLIAHFKNLCTNDSDQTSSSMHRPSDITAGTQTTRESETASTKIGKFKQIMGEKIGKSIPSKMQSKLGQVVSDLNNAMRSGNSGHVRSTPQPSPRRLETAATSANSAVHLDLLVRPRGWRLGERVILNNRVFVCAGGPIDESMSRIGSALLPLRPFEVVEELLCMAVTLVKASSYTMSATNLQQQQHSTMLSSSSLTQCELGLSWTNDIQHLWMDFMNGTCMLQRINLTSASSDAANSTSVSDNAALSNEQVLAMYINLYHCMLLHAFLVVGPPTHALKWPSFFMSMSYHAFGDIFSLAELEHCIIKKGKTLPYVNILSMLLPKTQYDLPLIDFMNWSSSEENADRSIDILFALNPGTNSYPNSVPVYRPGSVYEQLTENTRLVFRGEELSILQAPAGTSSSSVAMQGSTTNTILLPQLCLWYYKWFEDQWNSSSGRCNALRKALVVAPKDKRKGLIILSCLLPYFNNALRENIDKLLCSSLDANVDSESSSAASMVNVTSNVSIKYIPFSYSCHYLQLRPN